MPVLEVWITSQFISILLGDVYCIEYDTLALTYYALPFIFQLTLVIKLRVLESQIKVEINMVSNGKSLFVYI